MPSLERTTKTLSNAATHPHSSPSLCHFSNVASWMGWGQGTELQYWALLPGKPKSGRAKLSQLGTPTTESSCEAIYTGKSCGSQIDGNFVPIKEPMTWREVRLCLGLKIWFVLILVETNFNLKKSFFSWRTQMKHTGCIMWTPGHGEVPVGVRFGYHFFHYIILGLYCENRWLLM